MGKHLNPELYLSLSYRSEDKEGNRAWGGGSHKFMVEPIDYQTQEVEASLSYTTKQLQGGYMLSMFETPTLFVVNNSADDPSTVDSRAATPPDNMAHNLYLSGGYNLSDETRASFKISKLTYLQDQAFADFDPANPLSVGFIKLPGNLDVAIKNGFLYADSFVDLVVIDITDPAAPQLSKRIENIFPYDPYQVVDPERLVYFTSLDETKGVVIGYEMDGVEG